MNLQAYLRRRQERINRALEKFLPASGRGPAPIHQAMRYSVLGEGKRIRPILTLAACEAAGGKLSNALPAACALELIHAYSLVHDDLPSMDDDDFRRGKPSCHKRFGEAVGVLTGDALLTFAFQLLSGTGARNGHAGMHLRVVQEVSRAIGTEGMVGGQVADIRTAGKRLAPHAVEAINNRKTGALIAVSVRVGALLGGAGPSAYRVLCRYGDRVGLVFQLVDDLLDKDGSVRSSGSGIVRRRAQALTHRAIQDLKPLGQRAEPLRMLAKFILTRGS